jgi:hypothetical protein
LISASLIIALWEYNIYWDILCLLHTCSTILLMPRASGTNFNAFSPRYGHNPSRE